MKKEQFKQGLEVSLGIYRGVVTDINEDSVTIQFKSWSTINPWTGKLPEITFKYFELLDIVESDEE